MPPAPLLYYVADNLQRRGSSIFPGRDCAQVSLAPPIAALAVSAIAGPAADALVEKGVEVSRVRKISQCMAFLGPSALLTAASFTDNNWAAVGAP